jgi:formylglycine-generating enzyme required for sulfatase activity
MKKKLFLVMIAAAVIAFTAATVNGQTATREVTVKYKVETVLVPKGTFLMGSPANEPGRDPYETLHVVTLTKDYYMSKYPITNAQYAEFLNDAGIDDTGAKAAIQGGERLIEASSRYSDYDWGLHHNGSQWKPAAGYENHPVIYVSWYGAKAYAEWAGGDLPTEAQWERAARGGKDNLPFGIGATGKVLTSNMANFYGTYPYDLDNGGMYNDPSGAYAGGTTAVDAYPASANAYGLHDMHGNVYEWCLDQWNSPDYAGLPATDPVCTVGSYRVLHGGYWRLDARYCRSAKYSVSIPDIRLSSFGFRVVFCP